MPISMHSALSLNKYQISKLGSSSSINSLVGDKMSIIVKKSPPSHRQSLQAGGGSGISRQPFINKTDHIKREVYFTQRSTRIKISINKHGDGIKHSINQ